MTRKRLSKGEFVDHAPDNPGTVRVNHKSDYCSGDSKSLIVTRKDDGSIDAHCFRCGGAGYLGSQRVFYQPPAQKTELPARFRESRVPEDAEWQYGAFPQVVHTWLKKGGISSVIAEKEGFLWVESRQQLFIPVLQHGISPYGSIELGHVLRGFDPKSYLTRTKDKDRFYGLYRAFQRHSEQVGRTTDKIVLVEDVISGLRCGEICDTIALLGTYLRPSALSRIVEDGYKEAVIFLDGDNPTVMMESRKLAKRLPIPARIVETGRDPKSYPKHELEKLINEA